MAEGFVYLIGEEENEGKYKIGSTRAKDINKRLKQLQTGNPNHLYIKHSFFTNKPFKLEMMLHNRFKTSNLINEWFYMDDDDVKDFVGLCEDFQHIIDSLEENPFF